MAVNLNAAARLPNSDIVRTPKGRLSYASLFKKSLPKGETNQEKATYNTTLLFKDGVDLTEIVKLVEEAAVAKFGADYKGKIKVKKPFIKITDEDFPKMKDLREKGFTTMIRLSTKTQPQVILANKMNASESDAYSGRWAACTVNAYAWDHPTGGKGISLGLQNVQLLDHDERLGSARGEAADQFEDLGDSVDSADDIYS